MTPRCRRHPLPGFALLFAAALLLGCLPEVRCQDYDDGDGGGAAVSPLYADMVYGQLDTLGSSFAKEMSRNFDFCIKDSDRDWNLAFNFSSDLTFMRNCLKKTKGDLPRRLCTAAEIKTFFASYYHGGGTKKILGSNRNCNLTSWASGCEPGWSCTVGENDKVNMKDGQIIPDRILDCHPCCEGFFCPRGITCMIPCPLGAYCPLASLNTTTGVCDPYNYQLPSGEPNHTCGGANIWADVESSGEMFCPAGYYCPSTIKKIACSSGFYCRMGSTSQMRCFQKSSCKEKSENQDITIYGALLMASLN